MKIYSKIELIALAFEVLTQYPDENKVFARNDGNIFFSENLAELGKGKLKVYPLDRSEVIPTAKMKVVTETAPADKSEATKNAIDSSVGTTEEIKEMIGEQTETEATTEASKTVEDTVQVSTPPVTDATLGKDGKNPENRNAKNKK